MTQAYVAVIMLSSLFALAIGYRLMEELDKDGCHAAVAIVGTVWVCLLTVTMLAGGFIVTGYIGT